MGSCLISDRSLLNNLQPALGASSSFFLLFVSSASSTPSTFTAAANSEKQTEALQTWKSSLEGRSQSLLPSWRGNDSCNFVGVACDDYGTITRLNLSNLGMRGTLGGLDFSRLANLISLDISNNKIYSSILEYRLNGSIPSSIGSLTNLTILCLGDNNLFGSLPPEGPFRKAFGIYPELNFIDLSHSYLYGDIPSEIGVLSKLERLNLASNILSGSIPARLFQCTNLLSLNLSKNDLKGSIPPKIGNAQFLDVLDLSRNLLTGRIPQELGKLRVLETMDVSHNGLFGSIPHTLGDMLALTIVDISYNNLEGPLPNVKAFTEAPFEAIRHNKRLCGNVVELAYSIPTEKCDVYSFGVVVLETIMRKHPGDSVCRECSSSSETELPPLLKDMLDQRLTPSRIRLREAEDVVSIAWLAFACLQANPQLRPTMKQVSQELHAQVPLDMPFSAVSLEQLRDLNGRRFRASEGDCKF
ncbi:MDIS1-interacting receptor like kinase 2-like [Rhodamnia argentea]|uniref:MDIS1-interacting receptor like kinase 2-like n=1 Tax=Rhodamnia argentea TaxID=178133 RepID=A0ABM3HPP5_9MYRT|nr:MDIS1-interacting receptor like kinase 2-like [Rhodamnia argentea]